MRKEKLSVQAGWKLMGTSWTMPLDIKKKKKYDVCGQNQKEGRLSEVAEMFKADEFPDQCHKLGLL